MYLSHAMELEPIVTSLALFLPAELSFNRISCSCQHDCSKLITSAAMAGKMHISRLAAANMYLVIGNANTTPLLKRPASRALVSSFENFLDVAAKPLSHHFSWGTFLLDDPRDLGLIPFIPSVGDPDYPLSPRSAGTNPDFWLQSRALNSQSLTNPRLPQLTGSQFRVLAESVPFDLNMAHVPATIPLFLETARCDALEVFKNNLDISQDDLTGAYYTVQFTTALDRFDQLTKFITNGPPSIFTVECAKQLTMLRTDIEAEYATLTMDFETRRGDDLRLVLSHIFLQPLQSYTYWRVPFEDLVQPTLTKLGNLYANESRGHGPTVQAAFASWRTSLETPLKNAYVTIKRDLQNVHANNPSALSASLARLGPFDALTALANWIVI